MATTTLLPFNPNQTNQESDAAYAADSNRTGGFGTDAIWPSPLANKSLNQLSNYLYALFTAFAQKGFTTNDNDVPLLTAVCANFLTTADVLPNVLSVAFSPTAVFNAAASNGFQMTLTGNVTSSTIPGATPGQLLAFYFVQDGVGGRTVVFPTSFVGAIQPDPAANSVSLQMFRVDLAGIPRAATPVLSNNGVFMGALTVSSIEATGSPFSATQNGYRTDPFTGIVEQWGISSALSGGNTGSVGVTFPIEFPNACWNIVCTPDNVGSSSWPGGWGVVTLYGYNRTRSGFTMYYDMANSGASISSVVHGFWRAIGN